MKAPICLARFGAPKSIRRETSLVLDGQALTVGFLGTGGTTIFSRVADDWQFGRNVNAPLRVQDTCAFPERLFFAGRVSHASDSGLIYSARELGDSASIPYPRLEVRAFEAG